jgi:ATP-binding cassette subfamily C protein
MQMLSVAFIFPFLSVASNPQIIYENHYLNLIYNYLNFQDQRSFLILFGGILLIIFLVANLVGALFTWRSHHFTWSVNHELSVRLIENYLSRDYAFFTQSNSSDLQKNIQTEINEVTSFVLNPILSILDRGVSLLMVITMLMLINPYAALLIGGLFGFIYYSIYYLAKNALNRIGLDSLEDREAKYRSANEIFGAIKIAKIYNIESFFISRFIKGSKRLSKNQTIRMTVSQLPRYAIEAVAFTIMIGIGIYIIGIKSNFVEAIPILGLYVVAAYRLLPWMQQLYTGYSILRSQTPHIYYLQKEFENIELYASEKDNSHNEKKDRRPFYDSSVIEFQDVSFSYAKAKNATIDDMSFTIDENTTVGFLGETGSGKTTTIDLLLGLYFPQKGSIFIQGELLTRANVKSWQKIIGYVPQDIYLADSSIMENIAFGINRDEISIAQVRKVASLANIDHFIEEELVDQYETIVGERGVRLSGGQRQRIGIARALYREPDILVFDEATSSLDIETEKSVMTAIEKLTHKKTIIIIAHRLSTLENCDVIIKLDKGRIIETGTFEEVVRKDSNHKVTALS